MARNRLLEDKAIYGPDLLVALFFTRRLGIRMVGVMVRVRGRMGVDESVPMRVMLVAHGLDRVVRVRVRCGRQSEEDCQHRHRRTKTVQHDGSIVSAAYGPCQATTAPRRYNADMNTIRRFSVTFVAAAVLVAGVATLSAHAVVVDHDKPGDAAIHVRFEAAK